MLRRVEVPFAPQSAQEAFPPKSFRAFKSSWPSCCLAAEVDPPAYFNVYKYREREREIDRERERERFVVP
jgi:hypothetical protein